MFGANALGWPYAAQIYAGLITTLTPATQTGGGGGGGGYSGRYKGSYQKAKV